VNPALNIYKKIFLTHIKFNLSYFYSFPVLFKHRLKKIYDLTGIANLREGNGNLLE
jgi:hypothetical protein